MIETIKNIIAHWKEISAVVVGIPVAFGALLSSINSLITLIAPFTSWTWDDHLADLLGKLVANKVFKKNVD